MKISWRIKNIDRQEDSVSSLRRKAEVLISALLRSSVSRGSDSHLGCHSLPLHFESSHFKSLSNRKAHRLWRWTSSVWQGQEDSNPRPTVLEWLCVFGTPRSSLLFRHFCSLFRQFKTADFLFDALLMLQKIRELYCEPKGGF